MRLFFSSDRLDDVITVKCYLTLRYSDFDGISVKTLEQILLEPRNKILTHYVH